MRKPIFVVAVVAILCSSLDLLQAWGGQGHRLVGLIAAERLTPLARQNVAWLLDGQSLADVSSWADSITVGAGADVLLALPQHPARCARLRSQS